MDPAHRLESRRPHRRPTILIGSGATLLGRALITPSQAASAGLYGIDLDLRESWRSPTVEEIRDAHTTRIRSVWLPAQYSGPLSEKRASRLRAFLNFAATRCGLRTIVLPKSTGARQQGVPLGTMAQELAEWYNLRVGIRIAADTLLQQPGPHLEHVANMRRVAEEWDFDIALDLTSPGLEQWEAEAALMRLFPRLGLVRVQPWMDASGGRLHTDTARAGLRSVSMLADQAYGGLISVAPEPIRPGWLSGFYLPRFNHVTYTREEILATYDRIDHFDSTTQQPHHRHP